MFGITLTILSDRFGHLQFAIDYIKSKWSPKQTMACNDSRELFWNRFEVRGNSIVFTRNKYKNEITHVFMMKNITRLLYISSGKSYLILLNIC